MYVVMFVLFPLFAYSMKKYKSEWFWKGVPFITIGSGIGGALWLSVLAVFWNVPSVAFPIFYTLPLLFASVLYYIYKSPLENGFLKKCGQGTNASIVIVVTWFVTSLMHGVMIFPADLTMKTVAAECIHTVQDGREAAVRNIRKSHGEPTMLSVLSFLSEGVCRPVDERNIAALTPPVAEH